MLGHQLERLMNVIKTRSTHQAHKHAQTRSGSVTVTPILLFHNSSCQQWELQVHLPTGHKGHMLKCSCFITFVHVLLASSLCAITSTWQVSQHCAGYLNALTCKCRRVNRISEDDISSDVNSSLHLQLTSHLVDPHSQAATLPRSTKPCVA